MKVKKNQPILGFGAYTPRQRYCGQY